MPKKVYEPIGHHYIVEASGCNSKIIGSVEKVQDILVKAAEIAGATVWAISFSKFPPSGVSGVVVISESHLTIHTWPELGEAAVDLFTCGDEKAAKRAIAALGPRLKAGRVESRELLRGVRD